MTVSELHKQLEAEDKPCLLKHNVCPTCKGTGKEYYLSYDMPIDILDMTYSVLAGTYKVNYYYANEPAYMEALHRMFNVD